MTLATRSFSLLLASVIALVALSHSSAGEGSGVKKLSGEEGAGIRAGVAMLTDKGEIRNVLRGDERFAMCSTFKFLAAAAVLHRVDRGEDKLERFIKYGERDIMDWAPVTKKYLPKGGMTLEALCFAAVAYSDNTAGNLLLQTLGGPSGLTAYARSLGDDITRSDRTEPTLNDVSPGDERDTTTPMSMLRDMQKILLGDALSKGSREKLESWLMQNTTADDMIRAGVPKGWRVGDKTGRNSIGNINDIAIIRRPDGRPMLLCIYLVLPGRSSDNRAKAVADVARTLFAQ